MISSIKELCTEFSFQKANLITIHETFSSHSDFLIVSFMLQALTNGQDVTFIAFRENYAHFLALSKKMGKSIQQFGKNGKLVYIECFATPFCSQLPLMESSPAVYVRPPKFVSQQYPNNLQFSKIKQKSLLIIDALNFVEFTPNFCYQLFEQGTKRKCKIIFSGCSSNGNVSSVISKTADLSIKLENDVGGNGKFKIIDQNKETNLIWKWVSGKFELSKYVRV